MKTVIWDRKLARKVLAMTPEEREKNGYPVEEADIAYECDVHPAALQTWIKGRESKKEREQKRREEQEVDAKDLEGNAVMALAKRGQEGSAFANKTLLQYLGKFTEKQEIVHKLDGSFITREILRIIRELEDSGMATVQVQSRVLSSQLLSAPGQGADHNSQVSAVASPDTNPQDTTQ